MVSLSLSSSWSITCFASPRPRDRTAPGIRRRSHGACEWIGASGKGEAESHEGGGVEFFTEQDDLFGNGRPTGRVRRVQPPAEGIKPGQAPGRQAGARPDHAQVTRQCEFATSGHGRMAAMVSNSARWCRRSSGWRDPVQTRGQHARVP